ncbi:MAG: DUF4350 domain-containing protein [Deltaproteobacteria bacterium]|nr:DUF4350 domain-containing protein [Deltaproteobacteria bacterium]
MRHIALSTAVLALLCPPLARAQDDYSTTSGAWNGIAELGAIADAMGVEVEDASDLDLGRLSAATPLLILHPEGELPADDILRFLRLGGRVAVADDFGTAEPLLARLGVRRFVGPVPSPPAAHNENANLPIATPRQAHPLALGVPELVTNHPSVLASPLRPVFDFGSSDRSVVVAGAVGEGRVVLVSDPSVFIDNMLQFPGNRRFAENLLRYLAAAPGARVILVHGRFSHHGAVSGLAGGRPDRPADEFFAAFNAFLSGLGSSAPESSTLRAVAAVIALGTMLALGFVLPMGGRRYDGRWLRPGARSAGAGFVGKVQLFRGRGVNYLLPALVYRRELEASLVQSLALCTPAPITEVERAIQGKGATALQARTLRKLLEDLDRLASRDARGQGPHVSEQRMARILEEGARLVALASRSK